MSASRWVVSVLLACHICALTVGALPRPGAMRPVDPPRSSQRNALSALLTPVLDSAAARFIEVHQAAWRATAPLQGFVRWYIGLTGLGQRWRMFMNPPDYDEYLRARYYVGTHDTAAVKWVATELIFPAHREDQVRLVQSFRDSYTDKAIAIALSAFLRARFAAGAEVPEDETDLPENLAPVAGYFSRRFARESLVPGERVLRTELWLARAPNPAPGVGPDFEKVEERRAILQQYYEGPVEDRLFRGGYPPLLAAQPEADLVWVMEYVQK